MFDKCMFIERIRPIGSILMKYCCTCSILKHYAILCCSSIYLSVFVCLLNLGKLGYSTVYVYRSVTLGLVCIIIRDVEA